MHAAERADPRLHLDRRFEHDVPHFFGLWDRSPNPMDGQPGRRRLNAIQDIIEIPSQCFQGLWIDWAWLRQEKYLKEFSRDRIAFVLKITNHLPRVANAGSTIQGSTQGLRRLEDSAGHVLQQIKFTREFRSGVCSA
jgi:hypothetical protein